MRSEGGDTVYVREGERERETRGEGVCVSSCSGKECTRSEMVGEPVIRRSANSADVVNAASMLGGVLGETERNTLSSRAFSQRNVAQSEGKDDKENVGIGNVPLKKAETNNSENAIGINALAQRPKRKRKAKGDDNDAQRGSADVSTTAAAEAVSTGERDTGVHYNAKHERRSSNRIRKSTAMMDSSAALPPPPQPGANHQSKTATKAPASATDRAKRSGKKKVSESCGTKTNVNLKEEKPFLCPHPGCGKRFAMASYLRQHSICHSTARPFQCTFCGTSYARKYQLQVHVRARHTNEKPYTCAEPGCGKTFITASAALDHARRVHGTKPEFQCKHCNKTFFTPSAARAHTCSAMQNNGSGSRRNNARSSMDDNIVKTDSEVASTPRFYRNDRIPICEPATARTNTAPGSSLKRERVTDTLDPSGDDDEEESNLEAAALLHALSMSGSSHQAPKKSRSRRRRSAKRAKKETTTEAVAKGDEDEKEEEEEKDEKDENEEEMDKENEKDDDKGKVAEAAAPCAEHDSAGPSPTNQLMSSVRSEPAKSAFLGWNGLPIPFHSSSSATQLQEQSRYAMPALTPVLGDISNTNAFSTVSSEFVPVNAVNPMLASVSAYYEAMWACGVDFQPFRAMAMVQQRPQQPENIDSAGIAARNAVNAVLRMDQAAPNHFVTPQTAMPMPALANVGVQYLNRQAQQQQQQQQRLQLLQARQEQLYQMRPW